MVRKITFALALLLLSSLWIFIPQPGFAQDLSPTLTPDPGLVIEAEPSGSATPMAEGITYPDSASLLSGVVDVKGVALSAWDFSFSYQDNPTFSWFLLAQSSEPTDGTITAWDTGSIADGVYILRLRIFSTNGTNEMKINVRVNNQQPVVTESSTPTSVNMLLLQATSTSLPPTDAIEQFVSLTPTTFILPNQLPLPPTNPAVLDPKDILIYLGKGMLVVVVVFGFASFVLFLCRK